MNVINELVNISNKRVVWHKTTAEGLDIDYTILLRAELATCLFHILEDTIEYENPDKTKVRNCLDLQLTVSETNNIAFCCRLKYLVNGIIYLGNKLLSAIQEQNINFLGLFLRPNLGLHNCLQLET